MNGNGPTTNRKWWRKLAVFYRGGWGWGLSNSQMIWENPRLKKQQQQHVSSLKDFLVLLTPQRALEDPRREWRTKRFPNVWTHPFLEAHLQGLVFPRPRTPGQLPPERPPKAASDHPASSDICLWCLPVDKVKKNRQLRKPRGRKGWRKGSSLTVFSKKKKKRKTRIAVISSKPGYA